MAANFLESVTRCDGAIDPSAVAMAFGITKRRLADAIALPVDALYRKSRMHCRTTQAPLRDFAEFMNLIVAWHGTPAAAFNWFCWYPLFQFEGRTAEDVFKAEGIEPLKVWAGQVEAGVYI
jgi:hypothetical protein